MSILGTVFSAAMFACLFQNLIFSGGYGASEAVRMAAKPKQLYPLSLFIVWLSVSVSLICVLLERIAAVRALNVFWHAVIFVGVLVCMYFLTLGFVVLVCNFGLRAIDKNENIPAAFKGTPAVFIYAAILSLAFTGLTGRGLGV